MKKFILAAFLLVLGSGFASAQELFPIQQSQIVSNGTQPACMPGCAPPSGYHWSLPDGYDAEFWQGPTAPGVNWAAGTWSPNGGTYTFDTNGLNIYADCANGISAQTTLAPTYPTSGVLTPVGTPGALNYGVYEARIQQPGPHNDWFWRSNEGSAQGETDIAETGSWNVDSNLQTGYGTFDPIPNQGSVSFDYPGNVNVTTSLNTYTIVWAWDGSPHGSQTVYFNGVKQGPTYNLQSSVWDYGVHDHFLNETCPAPYIVNYYRYWKQMPN